jgi:RNA polymerase sigma factor (sigma-70 family)
MDRPDADLIEDYCAGSPVAMETLVRRHVDMVYAAAVRLVGDAALADDVTQGVFIVLMKKGRSLRGHRTLAGWLIGVTRHVGRAAIRARRRRFHHERAAARPEVLSIQNDTAGQADLAAKLDDALARLPRSDRDVISLRFLEEQSLANVGHALGISEEAARKRVARGMERLRKLFARRGLVLDQSELSVAFTSFAMVNAPLATRSAAIALPKTPPSQAGIILSKGVLRMFLLKQCAVASIAILLGLSALAGVRVLAQAAAPSPIVVPAATPPALAPPIPPRLAIDNIALQMPVNDVEANIAFFQKVGFLLVSKSAAEIPLSWASMDGGAVRIRLVRSAGVAHPANNLIPYFWLNGGQAALATLRDQIASQGIATTEITRSGETLLQFDLKTPDGYVVGFYAQVTGGM